MKLIMFNLGFILLPFIAIFYKLSQKNWKKEYNDYYFTKSYHGPIGAKLVIILQMILVVAISDLIKQEGSNFSDLIVIGLIFGLIWRNGNE